VKATAIRFATYDKNAWAIYPIWDQILNALKYLQNHSNIEVGEMIATEMIPKLKTFQICPQQFFEKEGTSSYFLKKNSNSL